MPVTGLDHVGILVADLEEAKRFLGQVMGLEVAREAELEQLGLIAAFFECGPAMIEVFQIVDADSPLRPLDNGATARLDHVAVQVDDLRATRQELDAHGVRTIEVGDGEDPTSAGGNLNYWTDADSSAGVMYQLIEKGTG